MLRTSKQRTITYCETAETAAEQPRAALGSSVAVRIYLYPYNIKLLMFVHNLNLKYKFTV
jgi:hypothetical protein